MHSWSGLDPYTDNTSNTPIYFNTLNPVNGCLQPYTDNNLNTVNAAIYDNAFKTMIGGNNCIACIATNAVITANTYIPVNTCIDDNTSISAILLVGPP